MNDIYIIGAGGFGREVAWLIERINEIDRKWNVQGYIDDDKEKWNKKEGDLPVLGGCEYLIEKSMSTRKKCYAVCAVGSSRIRKTIIEKLKNSNVFFATLIDPSVIVSRDVKLGEGTIICAGTIITVNVSIGNHVIINLDSTLGHDDFVADYVTIFPSVNVSGMVSLGECVELGTGVQVIQGKKIVENVIVGAGSVVIRDIDYAGTYVGIPTKKIK